MNWHTHPKPRLRPVTVRRALTLAAGHSSSGAHAPQLTALYRKYWQLAAQGQTVGKFTQVRKLALDEVCCTITKQGSHGGVYHPTECRALSASEMTTFFSFPSTFKFAGTWVDMKERLGNCVPPLLIKAIAQNLREAPFMR